MEIVAKISVLSINADTSLRKEINFNTVAFLATVGPWVVKGNPGVQGLCNVCTTPQSKGIPPG